MVASGVIAALLYYALTLSVLPDPHWGAALAVLGAGVILFIAKRTALRNTQKRP